jgi:Domain of unknown function DUF11
VRKRAHRGALTAALLAAALATAALIPSASAQPAPKTYGRKVYAHAASSTAKWTSSVQGQDGLSAKGEPNSLLGRAAVQETSGITRVRIHDVTLQVLRGSTWTTVAQNLNDRWNGSSRAYVVSTTPQTVQTCWADPALRSTYRVVSNHSVRRSDTGTVANRTVASANFVARALINDPRCKWTELAATVDGPDTIERGEKATYTFTFTNPAKFGAPANDAFVGLRFSDGLKLQEVGSDLFGPDPDPDPWYQLYADLGNIASGESRSVTFEVEMDGLAALRQFIELDFQSRATPYSFGVQSMLTEIGATGLLVDPPPNTADLEVDAALPHDDASMNVDRDPDVINGIELQMRQGDTVTYRFEITNYGPEAATDVFLNARWPDDIGPLVFDSLGTCSVDKGDDTFLCDLGNVAVGETVTVTVQARIVSFNFWHQTVTASATSVQEDPNGSESREATFQLIE